jgi:hypothetical protein
MRHRFHDLYSVFRTLRLIPHSGDAKITRGLAILTLRNVES